MKVTTDTLKEFFFQENDIELALLIGSRATGCSHENSDWDFCIQWHRNISYMDTLGRTEELRAGLANLLDCTAERIDIIDMPTSRLAMRATVASEGILLKGDNNLAWSRFLLRTWRDLEDFEWDRKHVV